jgi:glycerate 2-kinase
MNLKETLYKIIKQSMERFTPYSLLYEQLMHLPFNRPIYIFALGTAAYEMTEAVLYHASQEDYIRISGGLIITRYGNDKGLFKNMQVIEANHLVADENSLKAGEAAIEFLQTLNENDILLVLLSGGGSCLMEKPAGDFSLEQMNNVIQELYNQGADINRIDAARKQMSELKGGKLSQYVKAIEIYIYAMSDIPNDIPKYISSNPFYLDAEEATDEIGLDYHRFDNLTSDKFITQHKAIVYKIIANNRTFCETVRQTAIDILPFLNADLIHVVPYELSGESAANGREISHIAQVIEKQERVESNGIKGVVTPCLLIFGGITSANVVGKGNVGRCTEFALAAIEGISDLMNCSLLVYNTSGTEIFYDVAGAYVDTNSKQALLDKGIDLNSCLEKHDSFAALQSIDAIIPGENSTLNVNEIALLYIQ